MVSARWSKQSQIVQYWFLPIRLLCLLDDVTTFTHQTPFPMWRSSIFLPEEGAVCPLPFFSSTVEAFIELFNACHFGSMHSAILFIKRVSKDVKSQFNGTYP